MNKVVELGDCDLSWESSYWLKMQTNELETVRNL